MNNAELENTCSPKQPGPLEFQAPSGHGDTGSFGNTGAKEYHLSSQQSDEKYTQTRTYSLNLGPKVFHYSVALEYSDHHSPYRKHKCKHYDTCLNIAGALNWESFTCKNCSGEIESQLLWKSRKALMKDKDLGQLFNLGKNSRSSKRKSNL